ncbi:MAG: hypothetical protein K6C12_12100 [Oscillospiraceae bacterium]|nr:hypothetical protein [Oscillospiraceae bacterium]
MAEGSRIKYYVERESLGVHACSILMLLAVVFRVIGCWGMWDDRIYALTQIALPIFSMLLLTAIVWFFGRRGLWLSFIPVTLGAVFFIIKAFGFESRIHMMLCILLYIAVIALYFCTVFGMIRTKWLLVLIFGLPFLYHVAIEDLPALRDAANPVSFAAGMQEMSVLCIMLGLFFLSLSMKKRLPTAENEHSKHRKTRALRKKKSCEKTSSEESAANQNTAGNASSGGNPADPAGSADNPCDTDSEDGSPAAGEVPGTSRPTLNPAAAPAPVQGGEEKAAPADSEEEAARTAGTRGSSAGTYSS